MSNLKRRRIYKINENKRSDKNCAMDEEINVFEPEPKYEPISVCKCLLDDDSSEQVIISSRKQMILGTVARTENYLRERRIPELIRFLLTKVLAEEANNPIAFLEKLLDECMLFRAGLGLAPVLYETRHLEAVVKSFDPGRRGWLSPGQVRRAFTTLGLIPEEYLEGRIACDAVLCGLQKTQQIDLFNLLAAGIDMQESTEESVSESTV